MAQGYYTLEEASEILGMATDKLSQMAQKREIRAFADRGTWRFRTQDVEELSRRSGPGSNAEANPEAAAPKKSSAHLSKADVKSGRLDKDDDMFEFELSTEGSLDLDLDAESSSNVSSPPSSSGSGAASSGINLAGAKGKRDSDLHLVFEGDENDFHSASDSDAKLQEPGKSFKSGGLKNKTNLAGDSGKPKKTNMAPEGDSSIIELSDDFGKKDSEIKLALDGGHLSGSSSDLPPTEEVRIEDLDAELKRADAADKNKKPQTRAKQKTQFKMPDSGPAPFELSQDDLDLDLGVEDSLIGAPSTNKKKTFERPPTSKADPASGRNLAGDDDDDEVSLGELSLGEGDFSGTSGASGINLHLPSDTGVNLEKSGPGSGDEIEFELSLDADSTPAPSSAAADDSESSFELTLDDSGGLAPLSETSSSNLQPGDEKDIFETNFDIPALEEDSGSEAIALDDADTDLEGSSDFDLDPDEEGGSESQVVALDDATDDASATIRKKGGAALKAGDDDEEISELLDDEEDEEDEDHVARTSAAVSAAPANWGKLPAICMVPCVLVMFILGLLTFELLHGMWGYKQANTPSSLIVKPMAELFGADFND